MPQVKCEFCGSYIDELAEKCPNCGGVNANFKRIVSNTPRTIEDLKKWYMARRLPSENVTRFFIGKDIKEPRAYGIYQDGSDFIVYKNKSDGSRAVRYQGKDEAYAVNEIYMKLKAEILEQKSRNISRGRVSTRSRGSWFNPLLHGLFGSGAMMMLFVSALVVPGWVLMILFFALVALFVFLHRDLRKFLIGVAVFVFLSLAICFGFIVGNNALHQNDGYYTHNGTYYYCQGHDVYYYDNDDWYYYDTYDDFTTANPDYTYVSEEYNNDEQYTDFADSYYYEDDDWSSSSSSSDSTDWSSYDNDYDWDSGSSDWDSGGSDWDSDW